MLMDIPSHAYPLEVMSHHINGVTDTWWPLALWNSTIMREVNFLGTTVVGSIVYLSLPLSLECCCHLVGSWGLASSFLWPCFCKIVPAVVPSLAQPRLVSQCYRLVSLAQCLWNGLLLGCFWWPLQWWLAHLIVIILIQTQCPEPGYCISNHILLALDVFEFSVELLKLQGPPVKHWTGHVCGEQGC